jgi:hypothetical protein
MELRNSSIGSGLVDKTAPAATGAATVDVLSIVMMAISIVANHQAYISLGNGLETPEFLREI